MPVYRLYREIVYDLKNDKVPSDSVNVNEKKTRQRGRMEAEL